MEKKNELQLPLIVVHGLKCILGVFTTTFLVSYIVSLSPENIMGTGVMNIGLLHLSQNIVFITVYIVLTYFVDKSNRVSLLRFGILVNCALLVCLVFFGETIAKWILLAGTICGVSDAFYYASYNVIRNEMNRKSNITRYNIISSVTGNVINIIVPTILGFLIDISTYSTIAIYVVILSLVQFFITYTIKAVKPEGASFEMKEYLNYLKTDKFAFSKLKHVYYNALLGGFKSTFHILVIILTVYAFKTNLSLGILTSLFSIVTTVLLLIYKKCENSPKLNTLVLFMTISIATFIMSVIFVLWINYATLILLNLMLTITIQLSEYSSNCSRDANIKLLDKYEYIAEHQLMFEFLLTIMRIVAFGIFIFVGLFNNIVAFSIMLVIYIGTTPFKFYCMYKQREAKLSLEDALKQNNDKKEEATK